MRLRLSPALGEEIRRHGARGYPHEVCGALLGRETETEGNGTVAAVTYANRAAVTGQQRVLQVEIAEIDGRLRIVQPFPTVAGSGRSDGACNRPV